MADVRGDAEYNLTRAVVAYQRRHLYWEQESGALDDVGLARSNVHPVGREEEEHPGLALVGRDPWPTLRDGQGEAHESRMCQDARAGTFGGSEQAPVGFQESGVHARAARRIEPPNADAIKY